jgi:hypothetical protein
MKLMVPVDILIDGRRIGCAYWGNDGGLLSEAVTRASTATAPLIARRDCSHENLADGFAYVGYYDEHWPIRMCKDCRSIMEGRDPHPTRRRSRRVWEFDAAGLIAAQWAREWPKAWEAAMEETAACDGVAEGGLEVERGEVELIGALHRGERDGEILNSQAGRVENRDVVLRLTAGCRTGEHLAELGHVLARDLASLDRVRKVAVVTGLFPVVGVKPDAGIKVKSSRRVRLLPVVAEDANTR